MPALMERIKLCGRVAVVTGGGGGIGRAISLELATLGAHVAVADIDMETARAVSAEIEAAGGAAIAVRIDVADAASVDAAYERAVAALGPPDNLVNNAALGARVPAVELEEAAWRQVLAVGLDGTFYASRAAAQHMIGRNKGAIVNLASIMGLSGGGLYPNVAYHTVKGAVVNMTRALAVEWAGHGIRVNAVAPTFARTALTQNLLADPEMERAVLELTPLGRLVEPEEVAWAVCFLASDAASMITGHTLPVDGGWLAR